MAYQRAVVETIRSRISEPRRFIQIVLGPRQTGKTTAVTQALEGYQNPVWSVEATYGESDADWLRAQWYLARNLVTDATPSALLVIDGVQYERFRTMAGGYGRLAKLQRAIVSGEGEAFGSELSRIARDSASFHDLTDETACQMLLMGLCFGMPGYLDPVSNRETGYGRNDFRIEPDPRAAGRFAAAPRPLVTVEVKFLRAGERPADLDKLAAALDELAAGALAQIAAGGYDAQLPSEASGRVRWGVAFVGKRVAVACERA